MLLGRAWALGERRSRERQREQDRQEDDRAVRGTGAGKAASSAGERSAAADAPKRTSGQPPRHRGSSQVRVLTAPQLLMEPADDWAMPTLRKLDVCSTVAVLRLTTLGRIISVSCTQWWALSIRGARNVPLRCIAVLAATALWLLGAQVATAAAATLAVSPAADPVEDTSVSIAISGDALANRYVYIDVAPGDTSCASTALANYGTRIGTYSTGSGGSFSHSPTYTPTSSGTYTVCGYVAESMYATPDATKRVTFAVRRPTATLSLSPSADAVEETGMSVEVRGTTEGPARSVYVDVAAGDTSCASTESANYGTRIGTYSTPSGGGTFGPHAATYTPSAPGTYTVCGYVAESMYATPDATKRVTFAVRRPTATLSLSPSADAVEETGMSVEVRGTTEGPARSVYVDVAAGDTSCASTESANYGTRIGTYSTPSGGGTFGPHAATYTPSAPGTYTVCGYVAESMYATPDATKRVTFAVRRPTATLSLSPSNPSGAGAAITVDVAGTTEGPARSVFVDVTSGDTSCASTESANYGTRIGTYSTAAGGDSFSRAATYTPSSYGIYTVCGYVAESTYATPDATQRATFAVPGGPATPPGAGDSAAAGDLSDDEADFVVPTPTLLGPADHASGVVLNPTFQWTGDPASGVKADTMRIERQYAEGSREKLADISSKTYTSYFDEAGRYKPRGIDYYLKNLATFAARDNVVSVKLESPLAPGTYSWFVSRKDSDSGEKVYSARRTLVVKGQPLRKLKLKVRSYPGSRSKYPGTTDVQVDTTPYSNVRFELMRQGRRSAFSYRADETGYAGFTQRWSCSLPGGVYRLKVTVRDEYGTTKRATGRFRPVTKAKCHTMRRVEAAARRARARRIAARERARERREARAEARREQRYRSNCMTLGGIPKIIQTENGPYLVCVAPYGGQLPVPY
jgi:hypothetical protein